ncbi:MAG: DUF4105 domain-containing protein [Alphaproteobacteria bacterium]|nr:DUF4105 domain-containing protein [Alphaproteobacteria bacterium]
MLKISLFLLSLCLGSQAVAQELNTHIWQHDYWKNLLHYSGKKSVINADSDFFLSPDGYKNPKSEYFATLRAFADDDISKANNHAICRYPARFDYIVRSLNLRKSYFPKPKCSEYQEYRQKVPIDTVSVLFAAENNFSPSSMMGHTFLKLGGNNKSGRHEHSFSYFAALNKIDLKFYLDIITTGLDGAYILSPYSEKSAEYLYKEKRSLWEFELKLSPLEIERLKMHLWELKGSNIRYSLISHNCGTAVISILKTANSNLESENVKPFVTPMEYAKKLYNSEYINNISLEPTDYVREKIKKNGVRNVLNANKSSRIEISQHTNKDYTLLYLSPVYQDIHDVNNAYFDEMESKIAEISIGYDNRLDKAFIQNINILKMRSVLDYPISGEYSKHFKFAFENNYAQTKTNLKPTVEFGLGYGSYAKTLAFYILPKAGFRYNHISNIYLAPEIGIIANISDKIKIMSSYEHYLNSCRNNRGFNEKFSFYLGYRIADGTDIFANYAHYASATNNNDFFFGIAYKF